MMRWTGNNPIICDGITISDVAGYIISEMAVNKKQKIEINSSEYADGIYFIRIHTDQFSAVKKLIIHRQK